MRDIDHHLHCFQSKDEAADESNDIQDTLEAFDEIAAASEKLSASVNNLLSKDKDCLVADEVSLACFQLMF